MSGYDDGGWQQRSFQEENVLPTCRIPAGAQFAMGSLASTSHQRHPWLQPRRFHDAAQRVLLFICGCGRGPRWHAVTHRHGRHRDMAYSSWHFLVDELRLTRWITSTPRFALNRADPWFMYRRQVEQPLLRPTCATAAVTSRCLPPNHGAPGDVDALPDVDLTSRCVRNRSNCVWNRC